MSKGINKVILIGNLGRDPDLSYTPSGMAIATLSLATTESRKKPDGTWEDATEWHRVKAFGKTAEGIGNHAVKGTQIYVEGKIHYDSYEKDGVKRYTTDILANRVTLLGGKATSGSYQQPEGGAPPPAPSQPAPAAEGEEEDPDLPFNPQPSEIGG